MSDPQPAKKSWLKRMSARVKGIFAAVDDRYVQLRRGRHEKRRAEIVERLQQLPGGAEMLKAANDNNVPIRVVAPRAIDGVKGRFSRAAGGAVIRVSNTGDIARMTTTLWHELRHLHQHIERGNLTGGTSRLYDTRRQHVISLMIEADAFTSQALMALRAKKAGQPEYFEAFIQGGGAPGAVRRYLEQNPYGQAGDEKAFARGLFTEIMLSGLSTYSAKYLKEYGENFGKSTDVAAFRKLLGKRRPPPDFGAAEPLLAQYGISGSVRDIAAAYLRAQPKDVYDTLKLVEETVEKAPKLTEEEFRRARDEILARTKTLGAAFKKAAVKPAGDSREFLHKMARTGRPPRP